MDREEFDGAYDEILAEKTKLDNLFSILSEMKFLYDRLDDIARFTPDITGPPPVAKITLSNLHEEFCLHLHGEHGCELLKQLVTGALDAARGSLDENDD